MIWAGSEKRAAQGMADVTLVLDNARRAAAGRLPGPRARPAAVPLAARTSTCSTSSASGCATSSTCSTRAHLADNAFLFIGQGMVDQALALRPEERRPLFEEVAGVRRHERRRRKAEEQLTESEANLARVDDILAELRPQARRLAAQAEQQATRSTHRRRAGDRAPGRRRMRAGTRPRPARPRRPRAASGPRPRRIGRWPRSRRPRPSASALAGELSARAAVERERREAHETARVALTDLQLRDGRLAADLEAIERDRGRLADERAAAEAETAAASAARWPRRVPARDLDLEAAVTEADRELAEALGRAGHAADRLARRRARSWRRSAGPRPPGRPRPRRPAGGWPRPSDGLPRRRAAAAAVETRRAEVAARLAAAARDAGASRSARRRPPRRPARPRARRSRPPRPNGPLPPTARRRRGRGRWRSRGRAGGLGGRLAEEERRPIARAARKAGGRRVDEDLVVDPDLRAAVEAALADARARLPGRGRGRRRARRRARSSARRGAVDRRGAATARRRDRRCLDAVAAAGGGRLADAIRRDATGGVRRLLARAVWLPDLAACLAIQAALPPGWVAVPRDGSAVVDDVAVALGAADRSSSDGRSTRGCATDLERADGRARDACSEAAAAATAADGALGPRSRAHAPRKARLTG